MSNLLRILLFVPPMFLFVFPAFAQLSGTIEQNPSNGTYTVSVIPSVTWTTNGSITSGAGITIKAATGKLQLSNFQSLTSTWVTNGIFVAPPESPDYDYFSFGLLTPIVNTTYTNGVKVPLFSFLNSLGCTQVEIIDNTTDPLNVPNNSINAGIENYFSVVAAGNGINAYTGNTPNDFVGCAPLDFSATPLLNPLPCYGDATIIKVVISGGKEPYSVGWLNLNDNSTGSAQVNDFEGSFEFPDMHAGNYLFTVEDKLDSTKVLNVSLVQPATALHISMLGLDVPCEGNMDGEVQVEKAYGGTVTNGYHYNWAGYPSVTDSILESVTNGIYYVTVTDDNGCSVADSATVNAAGAIILSQTVVKNIKCNGAENGLIDLYPISPSGGQVFDFQWSGNANTGNFSSAYNLPPGTYSVTVTDVEFGCTASVSYPVSEPPAIEVDYRLEGPKCYGDKGVLEILSISNAQGAWNAEIVGGQAVMDGSKFEVEPGFPMRLTVEDAKGCTASEDFLVGAKQELKLELGESINIKYGEEITLEADYFPYDNMSFQWTPTDGLSCTDCPNPIVKPTEPIAYQLQMTDTSGCSVSDIINIGVRKSRDIYIPNAFSPNHDGINDAFYPFGGNEIVAIRSMQVFDRWGGKMFERMEKFSPNDASQGWDGLARDKPADPGTYLYTMDVEFIDGETILFSGEVNLMK